MKEQENGNAQKLLKLVNETPELPIVPIVDSDIVGDDYGYYIGGWGSVRGMKKLGYWGKHDRCAGAVNTYTTSQFA